MGVIHNRFFSSMGLNSPNNCYSLLHTQTHTHTLCFPGPIHILSAHGNYYQETFIVNSLFFLYIIITPHYIYTWTNFNFKINLGLLVSFLPGSYLPFSMGFCTIKLKSSRLTFTFNSLDFKSTSQNKLQTLLHHTPTLHMLYVLKLKFYGINNSLN